jgi:hypothetical protein
MNAPIEELSTSTDREEYRRTAFGLTLSIDRRIEIRGLGQGRGSVASPPTRVRLDDGTLDQRWRVTAAAAVRVREARLGETLLISVDFAEQVGYLLWVRDFGRVLISPDGVELLCEPDVASEDWACILPFQALPLAATIRGLEVLHASGVVLDGRALLIAGPPGAGKSSLAAALVRAGAQLLSDDSVALELGDGALTAHAGSIVLQLRPAEDERLSADERAELGDPVNPVEGKRRYVRVSTPDPVPMGGLLLLERSHELPAVERLQAVNPFELLASTFNLSVRSPERLLRQLDVISRIASNGMAYRLRVQPNINASQLAAIIQEQLLEL